MMMEDILARIGIILLGISASVAFAGLLLIVIGFVMATLR